MLQEKKTNLSQKRKRVWPLQISNFAGLSLAYQSLHQTYMGKGRRERFSLRRGYYFGEADIWANITDLIKPTT